MRSDSFVLAFVSCAVAGVVTAWADPDPTDTRLLTEPALSAQHVAFVFADDLWVADLDGKNVRRLTADIGVESHPCFSPDGRWIAFSAQYDGNVDVYTVPVAGGAPKRLTYHPAADTVRGFTPDGRAVLFCSPRHAFTSRYAQFFTVSLDGGMPTQLPIPHGCEACYSPDAQSIAYTPLEDRSQQWKHYRGGAHSRIWIYRCQDQQVEQIPQPAGRCNDLDPHWIGATIYFRSDRNGEYNLFAFDTKTKAVTQLTRHTDFPVLDLGSGGGRLVYEQGGYLFLFDLAKRSSTRLKIGVATDLVETRPRYVRGAKHVRSGAISPSGARAVFGFRGEIVTVPAQKGDPRNLTESPGTHDRHPAWSPDGKSIAYFSDDGGEYRLCVRSPDGKGKPRVYDPQGAGFYEAPVWSPDSKKIAYVDCSHSLYWMDLGGGQVQKIASAPIFGGTRFAPAWSPDSNWIAYALGNKAAYRTLYAHELSSGKSRAITDGLSDATEPAFDASGNYLYFFGSTDAGPVNHSFALSSRSVRSHRSVYLMVLRKDLPSPLARESDEEKPSGDSAKRPQSRPAAAPSDKDAGRAGRKTSDAAPPKPAPVRIDFDRIDQRILALPIDAGSYRNLQAGTAGQIYFIEGGASATDASDDDDSNRRSALKRFDLSKRRTATVQAGVSDFAVAAGRRKALVFTAPETWSIIDLASTATTSTSSETAGSPPASASGSPSASTSSSGNRLKTDAIEVRIDPRAEWSQIFEEAWRINRSNFYDPNMHGADWPAIRRKYAAFLPHLATRSDLERVIRWMLSELAVGHSRVSGGERLYERKAVPGGLLGADYDVADGRYRFKKVYGGLNWTPELRAPLTVPGVDVKSGEYLLAIRGREIRPPAEIHALLENTAGKSVEITVGPAPDSKGSRTVTVEPLADESSLRNRDWVEGNLRKVQQATGGRVAYVYVPDTSTQGYTYFRRYFYPQCDKEALIIDERFNRGGKLADYYIEHLRRPFVAMWARRYGDDLRTPGAAIEGPKVMIVDETAGSGGDLLPWMFRKFQLGTLVGKRTWGGLVGISPMPQLMDGARVTAPNLAIWTEEGWVVENEGVPPDVEVEQWPAAMAAGTDPQLDKAIEIVMAQLAKQKSQKRTRPPYPIRVQK
jgi:tricorn protease